MADIERDENAGPIPDTAWHADAESRADKGRVEIFNATRPGGLDGWTMDEDQYRAIHDLVLEMIVDHADDAARSNASHAPALSASPAGATRSQDECAQPRGSSPR